MRGKVIGIGFGLVIIVGLGLWFGKRHNDSQRSQSQALTPGAAATPAPANAALPDASRTTPEAQVTLTADDLRKAQIRTVHIIEGTTATTLRVPGVVKPDEYRLVHVASITGGIVKQVPVVLGDRVRNGQPLAVVFSSELADAETQFLSYVAELDAEHKKLVRTENLVRLGAASQQEMEEVTATHAVHALHVQTAQEKLKLLGASDAQIESLRRTAQIDPNLVVPAPMNGIVLTRAANVGLVVAPAQELFSVVDLSTVWVMASLNEEDFAAVRVGSTATITAPAYPARTWKGRVAYIQPQVDATTRTAQARIEVPNPRESLRIDMYADVEFTSIGASALLLPEGAVQAIGERQFVFLPIEDNAGSFRLRHVRLGPLANGYFAVLEGLNPGDEVVTEGSFILKSEAMRQIPEAY
jgi:membrane fusion protein, heavy metal efflux system